MYYSAKRCLRLCKLNLALETCDYVYLDTRVQHVIVENGDSAAVDIEHGTADLIGCKMKFCLVQSVQ